MTEPQATIVVIVDGKQQQFVTVPPMARALANVLARPACNGMLQLGLDWVELQISIKNEGKQIGVRYGAG